MQADQIKAALRELQSQIHNTAVEKGWWVEHDKLNQLVKEHGGRLGLKGNEIDVLYRTAKSMLCVSEIAEGIEALRNGDAKDDKLPDFPGQAVEIADDIIRQLDLAARFNLPVIEAIIAKVMYNTTRSYKHGNKSI